MKQIFDWLREQINKHSYSKYDRGNFFASFIDTKIAIGIINEAESKWESDCCELLDKLIAETPRCRHRVCEIRGEEACVDFKFCENCLIDAVKDIFTNKDSKFRKIVEVE